ncbi:hypothetical protein J5N97_020290 [Dioscorea zingiberensis]|uniref:CCHC-type domain-containing protein n=1 Tax=Dioscorea zingiberensis TaxID=325984 RepID=A0A9D5HD35_9LILI|nr:hypothetical protein J5N97_020290 [Dioscorea zingiberensis]
MELDKPLRRGVWVKKPFSLALVFVAVVYERLPVLCFKCGVTGHSEDKCSQGEAGGGTDSSGTQSVRTDPKGKGVETVDAGPSSRNTESPGENNENNSKMQVDDQKEDEGLFGLWLTDRRRRDRGRMQNFNSRSSDEENGRKTKGTSFEVLESVSEETPAKTLEHDLNGQELDKIWEGHVGPRATNRGLGRGGRGTKSRGGFEGYARGKGSQEGCQFGTRPTGPTMELQVSLGKGDRHVASKATREGRGSYNCNYNQHHDNRMENQYPLNSYVEGDAPLTRYDQLNPHHEVPELQERIIITDQVKGSQLLELGPAEHNVPPKFITSLDNSVMLEPNPNTTNQEDKIWDPNPSNPHSFLVNHMSNVLMAGDEKGSKDKQVLMGWKSSLKPIKFVGKEIPDGKTACQELSANVLSGNFPDGQLSIMNLVFHMPNIAYWDC